MPVKISLSSAGPQAGPFAAIRHYGEITCYAGQRRLMLSYDPDTFATAWRARRTLAIFYEKFAAVNL